jgi:hypothetical protein
MSRSNSLISLLLLVMVMTLAGCKSKPPASERSKTSSSKTGQPDNSAVSDDLSLPIDSKEMNELTEPDSTDTASAQRELAYLRRFKLGQSLDEVRKIVPSEIKLGTPTTDLPEGELPEDQVVVEYKGSNLEGFFYFQGSLQNVGKLVMVEIFTDDHDYKDAKGKKRIRKFVSLLGKPAKIRKEEDDDGSPLYEAEWPEKGQLVRYADVYEWGATLSLSSGNSEN